MIFFKVEPQFFFFGGEGSFFFNRKWYSETFFKHFFYYENWPSYDFLKVEKTPNFF